MLPDYYAILEVPPAATLTDIKRSYRRLVRKYHPDLNKQAMDQDIKLLNEAYAVLSNPTRRAAYDAQRAEEKRRIAAQEALRRKQEQAKREQEQGRREAEMTWAEGVVGFVRELKKALQEDS
jgi:curved DNA-binding protein CbpA